MEINNTTDIAKLILKMNFDDKCKFISSLKKELITKNKKNAWIGSFLSLWNNIDDNTTWCLMLLSVGGGGNIPLIKELRNLHPGLGLKEAKDLTENLPKMIRNNLSRKEAEEYKKRLELCGSPIINIEEDWSEMIGDSINIKSFTEELESI